MQEGVYKAREDGPHLGNIINHVLNIESGLLTGETEWSAAKTAIKALVASTSESEGEKIWGCAKGSDDAYNEIKTSPLDEVGPEFGYLYMLGGCVGGI
jgi:hypothetical protein